MKYKLVSLVVAVVGAVMFAATPVYANPTAVKCGVLGNEICDSSSSTDVKSSGIFAVLKFALTLLTGGVGIAAVAVFVYAGILYSSAGGDSARVSQAKKLITDASIGLLLYTVIFFALNWLIPGGVLGK